MPKVELFAVVELWDILFYFRFFMIGFILFYFIFFTYFIDLLHYFSVIYTVINNI